jgi:hypothetical protein
VKIHSTETSAHTTADRIIADCRYRPSMRYIRGAVGLPAQRLQAAAEARLKQPFIL